MSSFATVLRRCDDFPAFHAAVVVLTFLAAALLNSGFFALLIAGHVALDTYRFLDVPSVRVVSAVTRALVRSSLDLVLLFLSISVIASGPLVFALLPAGSVIRACASLLRMVGIVVPRAVALEHVAPRTSQRVVMVLLCVVSVGLLVASVAVGSSMTVLRAVIDSFSLFA